MISRIAYINIGLALLVGFFSLKTIQVWQQEPLKVHQVESQVEQGDKAREKRVAAGGNAAKERMPPKTEFQEVVGKNLFSSDRMEYAPPAPEAEEVMEDPKPQVDGRMINLFGVVLMDGYEVALINNPDLKSDRKSLWVKRGDWVGQLKVEQIDTDSVTFSGEGKKKFRVGLYDQSKTRRTIIATPQSQPTVVAAVQEKKPKIESKKEVDLKSNTKKDSKVDEQYEMISTPFGMMRRKKN